MLRNAENYRSRGRSRGRGRGRAAQALALGCAALVGAFALAGCGRDESADRTSAVRGSEVEHAEAVGASSTTPGVTPAAALKPLMATSKVAEDRESLPPDVQLAVVDTLVTPGAPVEIVVHATSDVTRIALSDGSGDTLPFVRDTDGHAWRVTYRVPLRPPRERWGVSVTAKTEANRWRRVWLFLHAPGESKEVSVGAPHDTTLGSVR